MPQGPSGNKAIKAPRTLEEAKQHLVSKEVGQRREQPQPQGTNGTEGFENTGRSQTRQIGSLISRFGQVLLHWLHPQGACSSEHWTQPKGTNGT